MGDAYVGEIRLWSGSRIPQGWLVCNGSLQPIAQYQTLYSAIGTRYGGDGRTTFAVPDLRSRVPVGVGTNQGLTYAVGQTGGKETVVLTEAQLPAHSHAMQAATGASTTTNPQNAIWASAPSSTYTTVAANAVMSATALEPVGNNVAHPNLMPYLALNFIIATNGIYPVQS